ncbi:hypothetical protein CINS5915_04745 [Campylobacter insulaenigrae]|uniref:Uncharacterized protein n=2 Tax=Campylobacter insulaenigrae TaxID=260714 RepID=A0A0A8H2G7_9BACT|nr:hypothetical protein [Campylobacter insulaenigrae]AJC88328.1 hypothetical protein CINS_1372 [Campylobacter insulaenigrae NCTC 12927]MCR6570998.1 hypothetical protein [Campylobacter insulaenigrae]MCR6572582.1 hypothetical protein [Campylobacter insulaenigrae]MCR6573932.1 hypothetical protein [Campylobacter insulaenigrae]MCR6575674.1 hypothetical protein [Campylobacter insulaenigrae]
MELNFFQCSLNLNFEESKIRHDEFLQDYLTSNNLVNLSKWKKLASRIEFSEGEQLIFDLLLDLKQELFMLKNDINKSDLSIDLGKNYMLEGIHFSHLKFKEECLQCGEEYYAKIELYGQKICFFFKGLNKKEGKIIQIKNEDECIYNNFVVDMQREMIKMLKEKSE